MITITTDSRIDSLNKLNRIRRKIEETVNYFSRNDPQNGARIYFEMRLGVMLAPFSELLNFVHSTSRNPQYTKRIIKAYLTSKPSLYLDDFFQMLQEELPNHNTDIDTFFKQINHFSILIREFAYLYGTQQDHNCEFGHNPYRTNMDNFYVKGNVIAANLLRFLASQETASSLEDFQQLADYYIRETIFNDYKLTGDIEDYDAKLYSHKSNYRQVKNRVNGLEKLALQAVPLISILNQKKEDAKPLEQELKNYFQMEFQTENPELEEIASTLKQSLHRHTGFELEFNSGYSNSKLDELSLRYQKLLGWENLYNKPNENMYDADSDGLIYSDATLPQRRNEKGETIGCPLEYSAPPFTFSDDGDKYLLFLNMIKEEEGSALYSNSETHQHIYANDMDLDSMKRLVLRRAWLDKPLLEAFHIPEKQHDYNRSACDLLTNISSYTTETERIKNYIIFSGLINSSPNKSVLIMRTNRGNCKYSSLNLVPEKTVEFRGMQGTFSKAFLEYYLKFNLFFVESAKNNSSIYYLPQGIQHAYKLRQNDQSPVLPATPLNYNREGFDPTRPITSDQEQKLINHDIHVTIETVKLGNNVPPDSLCFGRHQFIKMDDNMACYPKANNCNLSTN